MYVFQQARTVEEIKLNRYWRMEFGDVESCVQDFSDLGAEYKILEVSVPMMLQWKGIS
jgi:hypothetical protein